MNLKSLKIYDFGHTCYSAKLRMISKRSDLDNLLRNGKNKFYKKTLMGME